MMKGTPFVHLMIPLEGYYDYQPESAPQSVIISAAYIKAAHFGKI